MELIKNMRLYISLISLSSTFCTLLWMAQKQSKVDFFYVYYENDHTKRWIVFNQSRSYTPCRISC